MASAKGKAILSKGKTCSSEYHWIVADFAAIEDVGISATWNDWTLGWDDLERLVGLFFGCLGEEEGAHCLVQIELRLSYVVFRLILIKLELDDGSFSSLEIEEGFI